MHYVFRRLSVPGSVAPNIKKYGFFTRADFLRHNAVGKNGHTYLNL